MIMGIFSHIYVWSYLWLPYLQANMGRGEVDWNLHQPRKGMDGQGGGGLPRRLSRH